jgi:chromate reductase
MLHVFAESAAWSAPRLKHWPMNQELRTRMTAPRKVAVLVGSLRKASFARKTALTLAEIAPKSLALALVEIGQLPFYNQDDEHAPPAAWLTFRETVRAVDAVLFVTPEYNRSVPAALKNALDVASRPHGKSAWDGKPGAVVSVTPGTMGGFGANHHLRQSLVFLNVPTMQQPEAYIGGAAKLFDDKGVMTNESTHAFLKSFMESFAAWIDKIAPN